MRRGGGDFHEHDHMVARLTFSIQSQYSMTDDYEFEYHPLGVKIPCQNCSWYYSLRQKNHESSLVYISNSDKCFLELLRLAF